MGEKVGYVKEAFTDYKGFAEYELRKTMDARIGRTGSVYPSRGITEDTPLTRQHILDDCDSELRHLADVNLGRWKVGKIVR